MPAIDAFKAQETIVGLSDKIRPVFVVAVSKVGDNTISQPPSISVTDSQINITFDDAITLIREAELPHNWIITGSGSPVTVYSVSSNAKTVILQVSEQTNGASYIVNIPQGILKGDTIYLGPFTATFTGVYTGSTSITSKSLDNNTIQITFSNPVTLSDALVSSNYSVDGGVSVLGVSRITNQVFNLTTSRLHSDTVYTVTISNIRDSAGNLI